MLASSTGTTDFLALELQMLQSDRGYFRQQAIEIFSDLRILALEWQGHLKAHQLSDLVAAHLVFALIQAELLALRQGENFLHPRQQIFVMGNCR